MIRERTVQDPVTLIAGGVIVTAILLAPLLIVLSEGT